ncbi:MAG: nucleotidyltransferase domain-containing protein [Desulfatirhabdiaceae bacterium]
MARGVFWSFARGDAGPESDVDIVVELTGPTFDHYMDLKFRLEAVLKRPVDFSHGRHGKTTY